jgi:hypothetical protein
MDGWMDGMGKRENTHDHDPHKFGSGPFDFEPLRRISGPFGPPEGPPVHLGRPEGPPAHLGRPEGPPAHLGRPEEPPAHNQISQ